MLPNPLAIDFDTRLTAVLYGNFAVSGDQDESPICCFCGFIAEADDWNSFDHAWRTSLADSNDGFDALACLRGTDMFQSWDIRRRYDLLEDLAGVLVRFPLAPLGAFVVREHFLGLSSTDRAILAAEGVESPLDLVFYILTERIIDRVHEESEKISLLLDQEPRSAAERYNELFNKHLGRYLLGPHLMGTLAFADARDCSQLQAAKLLGETVLLMETQKLFPEKAGTAFPVPDALQQMTEQIHQQGRFDATELHKLTGALKNHSMQSIQSKSEPRG